MPPILLESETQTYYHSGLSWERWRTPLLASSSLVIGFAILFVWWQFRQNHRETDANLQLVTAVTVDTQLQVAKTYLGTQQAALQLLLIAGQQNDRKDFTGAVSTYDLFLSNYPKHELRNAALLGRASSLELAGQRDAAAEAYRVASEAKPADIYNPIALTSLARVLEQKGDKTGAKQALTECSAQYAETTYGAEARAQLEQSK